MLCRVQKESTLTVTRFGGALKPLQNRSRNGKQVWEKVIITKWARCDKKNVMGWLSMSNTNTSYLIGGVKEFTTASIHSIQFQLLPHLYYVTYFMGQSSNTWSSTDQKRFCAGLKWTVFDNDPMNQTEPTSNFRTKKHAHLTRCDMTSNCTRHGRFC